MSKLELLKRFNGSGLLLKEVIMSLLYMNGFDFDSLYDLTSEGWGYYSSDTSTLVSGETGHCMRLSGQTQGYMVCWTPRLPPSNEVIIGFRLKFMGSRNADNWTMLGFQYQGFDQTFITIDMDQTIHAVKDGSPLGNSEPGLFTSGEWNYFEFRMKVDSTNGEVEVRLNDESILSLSGVNTLGVETEGPLIDQVMFSSLCYSAANYTYIDDFYIINREGDTNNDFLGSVRIHTLKVTEQGNYAEWTPSGESTNYGCVDDIRPLDSGTKYVKVSSGELAETYKFEELPQDSRIEAVSFHIRGRKSECTHHALQFGFRTGDDVEYWSGESLLCNVLKLTKSQWETHPGTNKRFLVSDIISGEFGFRYIGGYDE
jgi:hypothetical protein